LSTRLSKLAGSGLACSQVFVRLYQTRINFFVLNWVHPLLTGECNAIMNWVGRMNCQHMNRWWKMYQRPSYATNASSIHPASTTATRQKFSTARGSPIHVFHTRKLTGSVRCSFILQAPLIVPPFVLWSSFKIWDMGLFLTQTPKVNIYYTQPPPNRCFTTYFAVRPTAPGPESVSKYCSLGVRAAIKRPVLG